MPGFGTSSNAPGGATQQPADPTRNSLVDEDVAAAANESALGPGGANAANALGRAPSDTYGTPQAGGGGTFGQDSLGSGALDDGFGATSNAAGLGSGGGGDGSNPFRDNTGDNFKAPVSSSGVTGDDSLVGSADGGNAFGTGTTAADTPTGAAGGLSGMNDAGGISGTTGAGAGQGQGKDSTVGKMMQKAGEALGNEKLQQKGQQKREQKAFEGTT